MIFNICAAIFGVSLLTATEGALSWLLVVLGIGFLIFVHELGHFLAAKYEKVRVEAFALGFGPAIISKRWGNTDYRINWIPLGGYVKMAGELPGEISGEDGLMSKTPGQRARILSAGVIMNGIFGIIGTILAFHIGIHFIVPTIGLVQQGSPAWQSGLERGDKVLEVNQEKISSFTDLFVAIAFSNEEKGVNLKIQRGNEVFDCLVQPKYNEARGIQTIGIAPHLLSELKAPKNSTAYQAGLRDGDTIKKIDNVEVEDGYDVEQLLASSQKKEIEITIDRKGQEKTILWSPPTRKTYRIGILSRQVKIDSVRQSTLVKGKAVVTQAKTLGFQAGDTLISIEEEKVFTRQEFKEKLEKISGKGNMYILRGGEELAISLNLTSIDSFVADFSFSADLYVGEVLQDYPAAEHLKAGDKLISANGLALHSFSDIFSAVQDAQSTPIEFVYLRGDQEYKATVQPKEIEIPIWGSLALTHALTPATSYGFKESCERGWNHTKNMVMQILLMLKGLASQQVSSKTLGGPITIFAASHSYLQLGLGRFIYFLALISINLAIVNLLPIPILDGGHLLFLAFEKITGRPVSENVMIWALYMGFLFLLFLIVYVTANDIERVFFGG